MAPKIQRAFRLFLYHGSWLQVRNSAISQLRFFTLYVLHKPWDDTQLPMRKFDEYLPYVPSREKTWQFISSMPDLKQKTMVALMYSSGLRVSEVCCLRYEDVDRKYEASYHTLEKQAGPLCHSLQNCP